MASQRNAMRGDRRGTRHTLSSTLTSVLSPSATSPPFDHTPSLPSSLSLGSPLPRSLCPSGSQPRRRSRTIAVTKPHLPKLSRVLWMPTSQAIVAAFPGNDSPNFPLLSSFQGPCTLPNRSVSISLVCAIHRFVSNTRAHPWFFSSDVSSSFGFSILVEPTPPSTSVWDRMCPLDGQNGR